MLSRVKEYAHHQLNDISTFKEHFAQNRLYEMYDKAESRAFGVMMFSQQFLTDDEIDKLLTWWDEKMYPAFEEEKRKSLFF